MGMCLSRREKLARINAQEREQMRAVTRLGSVLLAGALALAPAMALAQQAPSSDTPATDAIGPKDLQSFSLNGTVTRAAEQPAAAAPSPQRRQPRPQAGPPAGQSASAAPGTPQIESAPAPRPARTAPAEPSRALASPPLGQVERAPERLPQPAPSSSVTVALPSLDKTGGAAPTTPAATDFAPGPAAGTLAPEHKFPVIPWLLAALILGAGGAFLFWRNRSREAFAGAGGPQVDAFVAPEPAPAPRRGPAAAPSPAPPDNPAAASPLVMAPQERELAAKLRELREHVEKNAENVGRQFPQEARKIHYGDSEHRAIYGQATAEETRSLIDEGVEVMPLPLLPDERN